jgi:hypothetical protein
MKRNDYGIPVAEDRMEWSKAVAVIQDFIDNSSDERCKGTLVEAWDRILQG